MRCRPQLTISSRWFVCRLSQLVLRVRRRRAAPLHLASAADSIQCASCQTHTPASASLWAEA
ncbi:MAG: hypothetical protein JST84_06080 [Acidobacteria bacterium]|nr:hypothetical protein [Acidobacteriota bacterium]